MVVELLISVFFNVFDFFISLLPELPNVVMPSDFVSAFSNIVASVAYFLPLNVLLPLVVLSLGLDSFNVIWKLLLRIKSFIPTMGD